MRRISIPEPSSITTTINSELVDFDLSYSNDLKEFLAEEMDLSISSLKDLNCAYFSNYEKISNDLVKSNSIFQFNSLGGFRPFDNLLLISVDHFNLQKCIPTLIHEVGHYLSLNFFSVSIAEACALIYEKRWALKNDKTDDFNKKYKEIESYGLSLKLLDRIRISVFKNQEDEFYENIRRGSDQIFADRVDKYLQSKKCCMTSWQLFFLIDVLFFNRNNRYLSHAFKEKPPYFYQIFDELHYYILPTLFDEKSSSEELLNANNQLLKYKGIADLGMEVLSSVKNTSSSKEYIAFMRTYQKILANQFHHSDEKEYFNGVHSKDTLDTLIKHSIIYSFEETSNQFMKYQEKSNKAK